MLSRVADSLFWLGRYIERAENYARFIDVNFRLTQDLPPDVKEQWEPLITATGDHEVYLAHNKNFTRDKAIFFLGFDRRNVNSIISSVDHARENARTVRENLSREGWEVMNELYLYMKKLESKKIWKKEDPTKEFRQIKMQVQLLNGINYDTSPRDEAWFFTRMGQLLERADKTSRILDVKYHFLLPSIADVGSPLDFVQWTSLLKSVSAFNYYQRKYGKIVPASVVEYLVLDRHFPRSILYSLMKAEACLREISQSKERGFSNQPEKHFGNLRADLEFSDVDDVFKVGLHEYLDNLQGKLNEISQAIHEKYFQIQPNFVPSKSEQ